MNDRRSVDLLVIGSGPAGQKSAIQGAKMGKRVILVEQEPTVGGSCVHYGTIPSKTLRETAVSLAGFQRRSGNVFEVGLREDLQMASLMTRLEQVVKAHQQFMAAQLERNGIQMWHGRARFVSPHDVEVLSIGGGRQAVSASIIVVATGSRPRNPENIYIDHENLLDSDSILSMVYLPVSLAVLGSGVIASEYASIFASLGVKVVMIDRYPRPLGFVDPELVDRFLEAFRARGGTYLGNRKVKQSAWDGISSVITTLEDGEEVRTDKLLFALGRVANVEGLDIQNAGLEIDSRGLLPVDDSCRTLVPHIFAAGDVIGPPSLAASSMEQGRRAVCRAFGVELGVPPEMIPAGIYTIPEISTVGLTEAQVTEKYGSALVGRASFAELARGQIAAIQEGMIKLVSDANGRKILGVQIIGEGASELIHVGQMAILHGADVDAFVDNIFNFPTLAEGYRVAALDIVRQRKEKLLGVPLESALSPFEPPPKPQEVNS
ncbi:MAG: Si-specific NAD(P)(+) transhydrogenase [Terriglobia bacterium]